MTDYTVPCTPESLIETLQRLQPGDTLHKNTVGNLIVARGGNAVGYIDLMDGTFNSFALTEGKDE